MEDLEDVNDTGMAVSGAREVSNHWNFLVFRGGRKREFQWWVKVARNEIQQGAVEGKRLCEVACSLKWALLVADDPAQRLISIFRVSNFRREFPRAKAV
jgi:hypothetical protein